ncbi:hypothetical protein PPERSA_10823 [Pseudocohnilembus persalinus]|uniref:Uncharacterized protein n=1 Tax=Pseudocohnilembus persalinus TaxID=266149 RepID=A0A0V0QDP8_PSEPJ|nr:hypothetical protein PPERSA_10823 [Pseudocohnilembus persalinus]|eukprot:KRX00324.1 hypothetical protein PPERSA_10823 [Pseudocohnilembus persalinus]
MGKNQQEAFSPESSVGHEEKPQFLEIDQYPGAITRDQSCNNSTTNIFNKMKNNRLQEQNKTSYINTRDTRQSSDKQIVSQSNNEQVVYEIKEDDKQEIQEETQQQQQKLQQQKLLNFQQNQQQKQGEVNQEILEIPQIQLNCQQAEYLDQTPSCNTNNNNNKKKTIISKFFSNQVYSPQSQNSLQIQTCCVNQGEVDSFRESKQFQLRETVKRKKKITDQMKCIKKTCIVKIIDLQEQYKKQINM